MPRGGLRSTSFKKGQSGNPGGRSPRVREHGGQRWRKRSREVQGRNEAVVDRLHACSGESVSDVILRLAAEAKGAVKPSSTTASHFGCGLLRRWPLRPSRWFAFEACRLPNGSFAPN